MIKRYKGTSIIEILVATAMISIAIIAALSLANRSQSQNIYARNLSEATGYATQAADWLRIQRDTFGFATINNLSAGDYCLSNFPTDITLIQVDPCNDTDLINNVYKRQVNITKPDTTSMKFIISVTWEEKTTRQATIEMELSQW